MCCGGDGRPKKKLAPSLPFVKSLAGFLAFFTSEPVRYQLRLLQSRLAGVVESVKAARQWVMPVQQEVLSSGDWVECTLTGKQPLGDSRCTRYSFQFGTARQTFGLQLGQALSLLGIDTESKTTHRIEVIPSSQRGTAGSFEIVLKDASELAPVSMRLPSVGALCWVGQLTARVARSARGRSRSRCSCILLFLLRDYELVC